MKNWEMKRICHFQVKICISKIFQRNIFIWPRTYPIFVISQHYNDYSWLQPKLQRKSKLIRFKVSAPKNYKWAKEGGAVDFCMFPGWKWNFHFKSHLQGGFFLAKKLNFACFREQNEFFILKIIFRGGGILSCEKVISWKRWRLCRLKPHFWVKVAKS